MEWTAVTAIVGLCTLISGTACGLGTYFFTRGSSETAVAARAKSADSLAAACLAKIELLNVRLYDHEIKDAAGFAEMKTLIGEASRSQAAIETRLASAMDGLGTRLDTLTERLDRILDRKDMK